MLHGAVFPKGATSYGLQEATKYSVLSRYGNYITCVSV